MHMATHHQPHLRVAVKQLAQLRPIRQGNLIHPWAADLDGRVMKEERGRQPGRPAQLVIKPVSLCFPQFANDLAGPMRVETDQRPAPDAVAKDQPVGGLLKSIGSMFPKARANVVVPDRQAGLRPPAGQRLPHWPVRLRQVIVGEIASDNQPIDLLELRINRGDRPQPRRPGTNPFQFGVRIAEQVAIRQMQDVERHGSGPGGKREKQPGSIATDVLDAAENSQPGRPRSQAAVGTAARRVGGQWGM